MKRLMMTLILIGFSNTTAVFATPAPQDPPREAYTPPVPQDNQAEAPASFGEAEQFYDALSPYGEWLEIDAGFHAWRPTHVEYGWRPYLHGRWAWTDYGWYWNSNEPFGWATYHYGRWYFDDNYGWVWVPDRTWGPAWVEWRYNDDYLGWAPLPPYASFSMNMGIRFTTRWFAPYHYWNFVRYGFMNSPYLYRNVVPIEFARRLMSTTRSAGRYGFENGRIINRGVEREFVERRGGFGRMDQWEVRDSRIIGERFVHDRNANRIDVYRPNFSADGRTHERIDARRMDRGSSLDLQKVERGHHENLQITQPGESDRGRRTQEFDARTSRVPPAERKEIERRKEDRYPFPGREQTIRPQNNQQRSIVRQRPRRESRREAIAPRTNNRESRSAPEVRKESPRASEQGRREGTRRRG
jgi:hypothetical protein